MTTALPYSPKSMGFSTSDLMGNNTFYSTQHECSTVLPQRSMTTRNDIDKDLIISDLKLKEYLLSRKANNYIRLQEHCDRLIKEKETIIQETNFIHDNLMAMSNVQLRESDPIVRDNHDLKISHQKLAEEYAMLMNTNDDINNRIDERNREICSLKSTIEDILEELSNEGSNKKSLSKNKKTLATAHKTYSQKKKELIEENKKLSYECKEKNEILKRSERARVKLTEELKAIAEEVNESKKQVGESKEQIELVNEINHKLESKLKEIESELKELAKDEINLKETIKRLREDHDDQLRLKVLDIEKEVNVLKCQLQHEYEYGQLLNNDMKRFRKENNIIQQNLTIIKRCNEELITQMRELTIDPY